MKVSRKISCMGAIVTLVACSPAAEVATDEPGLRLMTLSVTELAATEGDPSAPFGTINDMLEVQPGVIAVADDILHRVHAWNVASGRVAGLTRRGQGPGEVESPMQLAHRPGGGFALYDIGRHIILLYGPDLGHERTVPGIGLISNTKDLIVLADGSFVLAGGRMSDPRHLHRYTSEGERIESWGDPSAELTDNSTQIQAAGGALRRLADGGFLFSFGAPLRVVRFAERAGLQAPEPVIEDLELRPEPTDEELVRPGPRPGSWAFQWYFDRSSGIFALDDGTLLNVVTRHYKGDSVWDLYDPEGNRLARTVVDRAYYVHDLAHDGTIVAHYRNAETDEKVAAVLQLRLESR